MTDAPCSTSVKFKFVEDDFEERRQRLHRVCEKIGMNISDDPQKWDTASNRIRLYVEDTYKMLYCPIHKVATANWRRVLMVLAGDVENATDVGRGHYNEYATKHRQLNSFPKEERIRRLKTYTKFLFVRHPFERVLSAYRDKFELGAEHGEWLYLKTIAASILYWKNRTAVTKVNKNQIHNVTFADLVSFIVHQANNTRVSMDMHWERIHELSLPCIMPFDYIGKYETLARDANYILGKTGADKVINFPPANINNHITNSSFSILEKYMTTLSDSLRANFRQVYELDFEMFGYK
ncbi:carbohydrate sulfotransferase 9-like [Saccoglossus kowalevskii]|uniref:Carbohydrate sulfotransferase n=1 Tax=Saccoglossus kowalevskii TaxID=10224 RepID=A0ABM0MHK6_SACKO|nr:PREDICTED: carbohydrate sulfotransferase 9-like [Saccoglossus kowalevskii]